MGDWKFIKWYVIQSISFFKRKKSFSCLGIALLLLTFSHQYTAAQYYQMQISTVKDEAGNVPSATFAIVEDLQGFIWFGTIDGLYRYDGFNYKIFRHQSNDVNCLSNNTIRDLAIDKKGIIWIATQGGGVDAFDPVSEKFVNYRHTGKKENEIRGNFIWSVLVDSNNDIWVGVSGTGVDKIEQSTGKIKHYNVVEGNKYINQENDLRCLLEDEKGNIWAGVTNLGLACINPETGEIKNYFTNVKETGHLSNEMPYDFLLSSNGQILTATFGGGVNILNEKEGGFTYLRSTGKDIPIVSDLTYSLLERIPGEYWIATEYGLSIYYSENKTIKNITQNNCNSESISENRLRDLFVDSKGIVWAGTESGVEKFVAQNNFRIYSGFFSDKNEVGSAIVKTIASDDDYFWVGFIDYGLLRFSYKTNTVKHYFIKSSDRGKTVVSNINAILNDGNNNLWVADWNYGLMKYNRATDNFEKVSNAYFEDNRLSDNRIQRLLEDKNGLLWIGTEGGLNRYNIADDSFVSYFHNPEDSNSLSSNSIQSQAMVFDKDSNLWLGTWSFGLNKMEFVDSERLKANYKRWVNIPADSTSLPNNNVISLLYDTTSLWIGTFGGGLSRMDLETGKFSIYTTEDGLPNNIIFAIFKDKNGNLWMSTDYGISMFDPIKERFYNYTKEDGLQDNHFFWGAAYKDEDGTILFGGIKGINSFTPEEVKPDTTPAKPVIVDIKLFNKSIDKQRYSSLSKQVKFHYYENFISFEFAALDYTEPQNNLYKYKLDGFDKDWIFSRNFNHASYTNLPAGKYTFKLQVANSDGIWNDEILTLEVIVVPPWWKTIIARVLFVLIVAGIIFFSFRIRINLLKKQKKKLEWLVEERTKEVELKNDELSEKYDEIVTQEEEIREQAEELRVLSEKLTDSNKNLAEKVKKRTSELEDALNRAEDSQKLISSFLSNFSHEIRTPLNAIMGFTQLIGSDEFEEGVKGHYAEIVEQNVQSLLMQIDNIMDVAKLHTGQYVLKSESFSLSDLFRGLYEEFKSNSKIIHAEISFKLTLKEEIDLKSDKDAFKGLILNLVENALKYTEKGAVDFGFYVEPHTGKEQARFEIGDKESKYQLTLFVKDTGIGIPLENQEIIFDAFRKIENTNKKLYRGTGVGLALVKNLTEKMGGIVKIDSQVNVGTLVEIKLPVTQY